MKPQFPGGLIAHRIPSALYMLDPGVPGLHGHGNAELVKCTKSPLILKSFNGMPKYRCPRPG